MGTLCVSKQGIPKRPEYQRIQDCPISLASLTSAPASVDTSRYSERLEAFAGLVITSPEQNIRLLHLLW